MQAISTRASKLGLLLLVATVLSCLQSAEGCLSLHGEEREIMDAREMLNEEGNIASCLRRSLEKGNIGLAKSIIEVYDDQHEKLFISIYEKELNRLKLINEEIVLGESACEPVLKWGQNDTHLFISMKMSHRWDSPPCLSTKQEFSSLTNQTFEYVNICVVSHQKIRFETKFDFFSNVVDGEVRVIKDGVGTFSTIIQKAEGKVWPFLNKKETSYPIWGEISERYNAIHKEYQNLLDATLRERKSKPVDLTNNSKKVENQTATAESV